MRRNSSQTKEPKVCVVIMITSKMGRGTNLELSLELK